MTEHLEAYRASLDQPLATHRRLVLADAFHQHRELVAAEPRDEAPVADILVQDGADHADHLVAGDVTEGVVDDLETVEVDHRHREAIAVADMLGERAHERQAVRRVGERIMVGHMGGLGFIGGELELLLLEQLDLLGQRLARRGELAVDLPAMPQRARGLDHFLGLERLGDVEDLVGRARGAADVERREVRIAGDDHQVDLGIEPADALGGLLAVDARRHAHVDEGDREALTAADRRLDRAHCVEPLVEMGAFEHVFVGRGRLGIVVVAEQFGCQRRKRGSLLASPRRAEALPIGIVHCRFVVHDQNAHGPVTPPRVFRRSIGTPLNAGKGYLRKLPSRRNPSSRRHHGAYRARSLPGSVAAGASRSRTIPAVPAQPRSRYNHP